MIYRLAITLLPAALPRFATLLLLTSLAVPAAAQQARSLNDCQNITDRAARFECYDKVETVPRVPAGATMSTIPATRAAPAASAPASPAAATSSSSTAIVRETEEREPLLKRILPFGLGDSDEEEESNNTATEATAPVSEVDSFGREESARQQASENRELIDTIASLRETEPNTWRVTLSNGQIWQQVTGKRYLMKEGDQVRIRQSGWGSSYRLYVDRLGSYIQVDRVD